MSSYGQFTCVCELVIAIFVVHRLQLKISSHKFIVIWVRNAVVLNLLLLVQNKQVLQVPVGKKGLPRGVLVLLVF